MLEKLEILKKLERLEKLSCANLRKMLNNNKKIQRCRSASSLNSRLKKQCSIMIQPYDTLLPSCADRLLRATRRLSN